MELSATIANLIWTASNLPALTQFQRALNFPEVAQRNLLQSLLAQNASSSYGRKHDFARIHNYREFAERIPPIEYQDLEPWVERICRGEHGMLTAGRVTHLIPTSGSTGARKLIPFTAELQREFNRAIGPWVADLYRQYPRVMAGPAYWSISPLTKGEEPAPTAVPIGFADDSAYLGGAKRKVMNAVMAVPSELRLVRDIEKFWYLTLLCLLRRRELRLISVWHPSFLTILLDRLPQSWDSLCRDIRTGGCSLSGLNPAVIKSVHSRPMPKRARELDDLDPRNPSGIWPALEVVSCWGGANAESSIADIRRRFPKVNIQSKGLIATEGIVTIPFADALPLAVTSHFFEFADARGRIHLAHEVERGETYEVIVTTGAGLWRYQLHDQVKVTGFLGKTPTLQFIARAGNISDRFGEKLSESFVARSIIEATRGSGSPRFAMLAPENSGSGWHYTLYIEGDGCRDLRETLESMLCGNPHYAWCRTLGQLQALRVFQIQSGGCESFVTRELADGARLGEIKIHTLSAKDGWSSFFRGY